MHSSPPDGQPPIPEHKPYVAPDSKMAELSLRAVVLGAGFGVLFGAVTVYLALKVGLTVSASIPIAVLSIMVFRKLGKSTILENNIVQTIGSAGESIAAGVVFTLPALIFLNSPLEYHRIFLIALAGGILGVLMMIPLRRALIVKEHATLRYPEGTACANILIAGEKGGALAGKVFAGLGVGVGYKLLMSVAALWKEVPGFFAKKFFRGFSLSAEASPELLGVGYIIGFRNASILVAGGVLSWTVLIPFVKFIGSGVPTPIFPGRVPIAQMDAWQIWGSYIRYIGAGAVAAGGVINLGRALPTIVGSFRDSVRSMRKNNADAGETVPRTERDLPMSLVFGGCAVLVVGLWALINYDLNPGHPFPNAVASLLIIVYGFFFVTVSSRVVGMIGSSNNPISGDTITTLMGTCLLFVIIGWTGHAYAAVALSIGAVVCIAAANAGATSQDLKTGFLIGATPRSQQIGLIVGVTVSVLVIGVTLRAMNSAYHTIEPAQAANFVVPKDAKHADPIDYRGRTYQVAYVNDVQDTHGLADGKYLVDETGHVAFRYVDGIGGRTLAAPQARLMSLVISGILNQKLPWTLVLLGIFIGLVMELCGVHALPFAVGVYLPLSTTTPVFFGGLMKLISDKLAARRRGPDAGPPPAEDDASEGMLFSSGLIAGGALMGVGVAALILASGESQGLANLLEALRGDGIKVEAPADATVTIGGHEVASGAMVPVRSRWFETTITQPDGSTLKKRKLEPAIEEGGAWKIFESLPVEVRTRTGEHDAAAVEYDAEARGRTIRFEPVDTWDAPVIVDALPPKIAEGTLGKWLVAEGAAVDFGTPMARIDTAGGPVEIKSSQQGRLAKHEVADGASVGVRTTIGTLELPEPPIGSIKPVEPTLRRRIVVAARPGSDAWAMSMFLFLCAILVWSALPRAKKPA
jgi:putative OPT family oligopeptide transporter